MSKDAIGPTNGGSKFKVVGGTVIADEKEKLEILYPVNHELAIFDSLEIQHLEWWADCYDNSTDNSHPLDILYFKNKL